jgi:hypothetical protein
MKQRNIGGEASADSMNDWQVKRFLNGKLMKAT